ncbi:hypothetical protein RI129_009731 [Pyrocoelia pectoralis]|uniref:Uncharacterized protein n=1 Tax=Pyrocoelia pectoralis TaxID=417401 RepID=A0AAN7V7X5_9COLE
MKYVAIILNIAFFVSIVHGKSIKKIEETCKCWEGYKAKGDGSECVGILVRPVMACNEPEPPPCKCTENATDIINESTGLWCRNYVKGVEIKRWRCENQDEWAKFFQRYPDYKV